MINTPTSNLSIPLDSLSYIFIILNPITCDGKASIFICAYVRYHLACGAGTWYSLLIREKRGKCMVCVKVYGLREKKHVFRKKVHISRKRRTYFV